MEIKHFDSGILSSNMYVIEEDDHVVSGAALMNAGYTFPPMMGDYPAAQLHLSAVGC